MRRVKTGAGRARPTTVAGRAPRVAPTGRQRAVAFVEPMVPLALGRLVGDPAPIGGVRRRRRVVVRVRVLGPGGPTTVGLGVVLAIARRATVTRRLVLPRNGSGRIEVGRDVTTTNVGPPVRVERVRVSQVGGVRAEQIGRTGPVGPSVSVQRVVAGPAATTWVGLARLAASTVAVRARPATINAGEAPRGCVSGRRLLRSPGNPSNGSTRGRCGPRRPMR